MAAAAARGVVVQDVQAAEAFDGERDGRLQLRELADVGVPERDAAAAGPELGRERFPGLVRDVRGDDRRTLGHETANDRRPDSRGATGHDRYLAVEPPHGRLAYARRRRAVN